MFEIKPWEFWLALVCSFTGAVALLAGLVYALYKFGAWLYS